MQASRKLRRIQRISIFFLTLAGCINYLDRSALSVANSTISGEMGLTAAQMGLLLSAFSMSYAFAQLPVGVLLDRLGARFMLGVGMLLWSVAQLCTGFVHGIQQFFFARVCLGIGEAPQFPAGAKVIGEWFALRDRGAPTGIFVASTTIGPAIAPPILTGLMLALSWREMFVVTGVFGVLVALGWYVVYRNRSEVDLTPEELAHLAEGSQEEPNAAPLNGAQWRNLFGQRTTWGMLFGFMGVIYMVWLYLTWLPAYLEHERGMSIARAGWVVAIPYFVGTLGMVGSGYIADWLYRRGMAPITSRKWPICVGLVGAAAATVPAALTPSAWMAIVYISIAMFFLNMASGGAWSLVSVAAPRQAVASLGGIQNFGGFLAGSAAPIVTGLVVDRTHSFVNALIVSAAVAVLSAVAYIILVRRPVSVAQRHEQGAELATVQPAE
ncbi:sugar phosphate permease [Paraburkholderia unamae]|uniref:MFS transporter n=1 Tax=Paraburkholderia unamae TaxID=219649 RepID=UPI000DC4E1F3|nr:MFS transporter [Paraburkholderia unamae]RAR53553.1 sugar phosphate permease [Paraburkholderia unamae]